MKKIIALSSILFLSIFLVGCSSTGTSNNDLSYYFISNNEIPTGYSLMEINSEFEQFLSSNPGTPSEEFLKMISGEIQGIEFEKVQMAIYVPEDNLEDFQVVMVSKLKEDSMIQNYIDNVKKSLSPYQGVYKTSEGYLISIDGKSEFRDSIRELYENKFNLEKLN